MLGSILIFSGTKAIRQKISEDLLTKMNLTEKINPDLLILEPEKGKKSIGIKETKNCLKWLNEKPFSAEHKAVMIPNADKLTLDAQNSMLKTLEEPPKYASIILISKSQEDLLTTVVSRCFRINASDPKHTNSIISELPNPDVTTPKLSFTKFLELSVLDRLEKVSEINKDEKESTLEMLESWIEEIHRIVQTTHNPQRLVKAYSVIKEVKSTLEKSNTSQKFALDYICICV